VAPSAQAQGNAARGGQQRDRVGALRQPRGGVQHAQAEPAQRRAGDRNVTSELVNGAELVGVWDRMYLPPWVRAAWQPLIDAARTAA
jgi:hypothetical protein